MSEKKDDFIKKLDELIELFDKLRQKATREGIILDKDPLYNNFELLANNYKMIKQNLPDDLVDGIGEPIKEVITEMVEQLKKELGVEETAGDSNKKETNLMDEMHKIDELLKSNNLSEQEINDLLDRRSKF